MCHSPSASRPPSAGSIKSSPDLLISEVRLGQFNGLHLVIRSQSAAPEHARDPAGPYPRPGHRVRRPASRCASISRSRSVRRSCSRAVSRLLAESNPQRRWPRKQPIEGLVAHIARRPARVVDLSYGGIRLELPPAGSIPARFHMAIRGFEVVFRARPVWTRYTAVGSISCGAEVSEANPQTLAQWRDLVDSVQGAA